MQEFPVNIYVYTFCYNEIELLPFVVEYWKRYAKKVVVYDNFSSDGSDKYLQQFDWVEVRKYDTGGKYNPDIIQEMKNNVWKETRDNNDVDYVMVCDLDEVLFITDDYMSMLNTYKDNGNVLLNSYIAECTNKVLPNYQEGYLAQEYEGTECLKTNRTKYCIFNPHKVKEIGYKWYTKYISTVGYYKSTIGPLILHLKMFGNERFSLGVAEMARRCKAKEPKLALQYGTSRTNAIANMIGHTACTTKVPTCVKVQKSTKQKFGSYKDLQWTETSLIHGNNTSNDQCIIVIPIYKTTPTRCEIASIKRAVEILGPKYEICLCCPDNMYVEGYKYKYNYDFSILKCNSGYFQGQETYSWLCESAEWYKCFSDYKYMLIYQPDGWIFEDKLQEFIDMDYDYYGSPWNSDSSPLIKHDMVGNGGVSLRKILPFIDVCENANWDLYESRHVKYEDLVFCLDLNDKLNICPVDVAIKFSFDASPEYWFNRNHQQLPMAAHAWLKWKYPDFWSNYIIP